MTSPFSRVYKSEKRALVSFERGTEMHWKNNTQNYEILQNSLLILCWYIWKNTNLYQNYQQNPKRETDSLFLRQTLLLLKITFWWYKLICIFKYLSLTITIELITATKFTFCAGVQMYFYYNQIHLFLYKQELLCKPRL